MLATNLFPTLKPEPVDLFKQSSEASVPTPLPSEPDGVTTASGRGNLIETLVGDPESYDSFQSRLYRFLRRLEFGRHDAEDAFQEAMLKVAGRLSKGTLSEIREPQKWVWKVAVNAAYTIARRRHELTAASLPEPVILPFEALDDAEEKQVRLAAIQSAAGRLRKEQRLVLLHCDFEGQTIKSAAEEFNMTLGAASGHLTRARVALRAELASVTSSDDSREKPLSRASV